MKKKQPSDDVSLLRPNLSHLAARYPALAAHLHPAKGGVDLKDPETLRQLTIATLEHEFRLQVHLPADRLCPPVPSRLSYLDFLHSLLQPSSPMDVPLVLDIGVGCSCIYPLLGHRRYGWRFLASDIDPASVESAARNVAANRLEGVIQVCLVNDSLPLQSHLLSLPCCNSTESLITCDPDRLVDQLLGSTKKLRDLRGPVRRLASDL